MTAAGSPTAPLTAAPRYPSSSTRGCTDPRWLVQPLVLLSADDSVMLLGRVPESLLCSLPGHAESSSDHSPGVTGLSSSGDRCMQLGLGVMHPLTRGNDCPKVRGVPGGRGAWVESLKACRVVSVRQCGGQRHHLR